MSEHLPQTSDDVERLMAMHRVVERYFPDDIKFILEQLHDEEDEISFLYGQLLEIGEDSDEVLIQYGVIERNEDEV